MAAAYHAGLPEDTKADVHRTFVEGRLRVVVATIAFAMGADVPNVRAVVHWGACKNWGAYYPQTGRAGRDGDPAKCTLFWSQGDFQLLSILLNSSKNSGGSGGGGGAAHYRPEDGLLQMRRYAMASAPACRRRMLLQYSGELPADAAAPADAAQAAAAAAFRCSGCDCCDAVPDPGAKAVDISSEARCYEAAAALAGGNSGITTIKDILAGSHSKLLKPLCAGPHVQAPRGGRGSSCYTNRACLTRCGEEGGGGLKKKTQTQDLAARGLNAHGKVITWSLWVTPAIPPGGLPIS